MRDAGYEGRMAYGFPTKIVPNGVAILTFEIEPIEWHLLHHQVEPLIAEAMRDQRLTVGMTEEQARATLMKTCVIRSSVEATGAKILQWFEPIDLGRSRRLKWTALLENGRIATVAAE